MASYAGYNPSEEIPDLAGKVILITGGRLPVLFHSMFYTL